MSKFLPTAFWVVKIIWWAILIGAAIYVIGFAGGDGGGCIGAGCGYDAPYG